MDSISDEIEREENIVEEDLSEEERRTILRN